MMTVVAAKVLAIRRRGLSVSLSTLSVGISSHPPGSLRFLPPRGPAFVVSITHSLDAYLRAPNTDANANANANEKDRARERGTDGERSPQGSLTTLGDKSCSFGAPDYTTAADAIHRFCCYFCAKPRNSSRTRFVHSYVESFFVR